MKRKRRRVVGRRITLTVGDKAEEALANLSKEGFFGDTISNVAHTLLMDGFRSHVENGHINLPGAFTALLERQKAPKRARTAISPFIQNKSQIIQQSNVIIFALQETLNYDPARHHNQPPPDLWTDDAAYLQEIKNLVAELKRLNDILERPVPNTRQAKRSTVQLAKHFNTYLHHVAVGTGRGTAALLIATMAGLLYQTGIGTGLLDGIWEHLKLPK
jgi:hypothetical protein